MFISKLADAAQEAAETQTWLEFAVACHYLDKKTFERLDGDYEHIFAMLHVMEDKSDAFCKRNS